MRLRRLLMKMKGSERDLGHDYIVGIEERLQNQQEKPSRQVDPIDDLMDGGLGSGELGVVVRKGIGKTWCLQSMGISFKNGLNVVHYTLELNQNYVGLRYDTIFSGVPTANIKFYQDDVKKKDRRS